MQDLSHLHASTRRNIRKATRLGVEVDTSISQEALDVFYRLHCLTRKRHQLPVQPFLFFQNIHDVLLSQGLGHFVRAVHEGKTIAAAVFLHFGDHALFKFGASDLAHQHLRMNDIVFWEAIRWFKEHGFRTLDFGRTDLENVGLRRFKSGWRSEEYPIRYYKYDVRAKTLVRSASEGRDSIVRSTFRVMPIPISRAISTVLYGRLG